LQGFTVAKFFTFILLCLNIGSVYETFSTAMAQFIHLLISEETLSEALQVLLFSAAFHLIRFIILL